MATAAAKDKKLMVVDVVVLRGVGIRTSNVDNLKCCAIANEQELI